MKFFFVAFSSYSFFNILYLHTKREKKSVQISQHPYSAFRETESKMQNVLCVFHVEDKKGIKTNGYKMALF
jgi:hypothetical protein